MYIKCVHSKCTPGGIMSKPRLSSSERTKKRLENLVAKGVFKDQTSAVDFAVELLMKFQLEKESEIIAKEYKQDLIVQELQLKTQSKSKEKVAG